MTPRARRGGEDRQPGRAQRGGKGERAGESPEGEWASSRAGPFKSGSHVQIKFRLLSRPSEPLLLAQGEVRLHAARVRVASHWAIAAVSHQEGDMTDTKLLRHSLDSAAPLKPQRRRAFGVPGGGYDTRQWAPSARWPLTPSLDRPQLTPAHLALLPTPRYLKRRAKCGYTVKVGFSESQPRWCPLTLSTCSTR